MGSLSAGVGGYSLCLFLQLPSFLTFRGRVCVFFCFFFCLISCRLVGCLISYSLSHFDLCVVISVFRLPPYSSYFSSNIFLNVMFLVSYTYIYFLNNSLFPSLFFFFYFPSNGLVGGSFAHLISQFFGWLTPPARHTLHPSFACPTIRLLLRLSNTAISRIVLKETYAFDG